MGVTINSAVIPIVLAMFWERLTGLAMIAGSIGGTVLALITWISVTASYPGGLKDFKDNASTNNLYFMYFIFTEYRRKKIILIFSVEYFTLPVCLLPSNEYLSDC
jgi:Na+/proline symporter